MKPSFKRLWGVPVALGIFTAAGLLSALLGDGIWDDLSALALAIPVAVAAWHIFRKSG